MTIDALGAERATQFVSDGGAAPIKLGQSIAQQIEQGIIEQGWPLGENLGSEAELMEHFGVSRAAFREATRILEDHKTAVMRRGRGGGLFVTAPDPASIARVSALYLDYSQISNGQLVDARSTVELRIVEAATKLIDERGASRLRSQLDEDARWISQGIPDASSVGRLHEFHGLVAELAQNPALALFLEVLVILTHDQKILSWERKSARARRRALVDTLEIHQQIAEAIISGDSSLAVLRMREHVDGTEHGQ